MYRDPPRRLKKISKKGSVGLVEMGKLTGQTQQTQGPHQLVPSNRSSTAFITSPGRDSLSLHLVDEEVAPLRCQTHGAMLHSSPDVKWGQDRRPLPDLISQKCLCAICPKLGNVAAQIRQNSVVLELAVVLPLCPSALPFRSALLPVWLPIDSPEGKRHRISHPSLPQPLSKPSWPEPALILGLSNRKHRLSFSEGPCAIAVRDQGQASGRRRSELGKPSSCFRSGLCPGNTGPGPSSLSEHLLSLLAPTSTTALAKTGDLSLTCRWGN